MNNQGKTKPEKSLILEIKKDVKDRLKLPSSLNTSELAMLTGYDVDKLLHTVQTLA